MSNKNQKKSTKAITPPADISQPEQSGGVNIERSTANISGDITGRDKTVIHVENANFFVNQHSSADALIPKAQQKRIFISYSHHLESDKKLATFLNDFLRHEGHIPFIDKSMRTGTAWLEEIDKQIKSSDLLIVLLSKDSADSEMIKSEIQRAYEYRKLQGRPQILPIRINYEGLLPYAISAFINHLHYAIWDNESDNEKVGRDILLALSGKLPAKTFDISAPITLEQLTISEDGRRITKTDEPHPPLPEFDPRFLDDLEAPGGTIKQNDRFYIERDADRQLKREIAKSGTTITIRAPRQTGKSSLLVRGLHVARSNAKIINIDLQGIDRDHLATPDVFLHHLANLTAYKLNISPEKIEKIWNSPLGSQDKLTRVFEDIILPSNEQRIVSSSRKGLNMVYLALSKETKPPCPNPSLKITQSYDLNKC